MPIHTWMSWEAGVDILGATRPGLAMPNVLVHVARVVHTPIGSAPAGMVMFQPDPQQPPKVLGFVSTDAKLAAWFGANVFAGTPFANAPALTARIEIETRPERASARVEVAGLRFDVVLSQLSPAELVHRSPGQPMPFAIQGLEARAAAAELRVDGALLPLTIPAIAMNGAPGAVFSACGVYAR
jgi:hypothetical protein